MFPISPEEEKKFFEKSREWDEGRVEKAENRAKIAYAITGGVMVLCVLLAIALIVSISARKVFPFAFVMHSDHTTDVLDLLSDPKKNYGEDIDNYWIRQEIKNRENWNDSQGQLMYNTAQLFHSDSQQKFYKAESNPDNPDSFTTKYGKRFDVIATENSPPIRVSYDDRTGIAIATYRWKKSVVPTNGNPALPSVNMVTTITYMYTGAPQKQSVRAINPLGFQVIDYRADIDQGGH